MTGRSCNRHGRMQPPDLRQARTDPTAPARIVVGCVRRRDVARAADRATNRAKTSRTPNRHVTGPEHTAGIVRLVIRQ
ncbi:hypothetical protein GCM10011354_09020 [Egicoccus halophilus]|uniref:Uncharacterized protein n=1 Tax=Egicoccus halophilus TaxID=1670830 RepID=A0A8J3EWU1_9ACTN|nr:hypothetical protein GCM10011354_09020 [Egicoccus halophilus]